MKRKLFIYNNTEINKNIKLDTYNINIFPYDTAILDFERYNDIDIFLDDEHKFILPKFSNSISIYDNYKLSFFTTL